MYMSQLESEGTKKVYVKCLSSEKCYDYTILVNNVIKYKMSHM